MALPLPTTDNPLADATNINDRSMPRHKDIYVSYSITSKTSI